MVDIRNIFKRVIPTNKVEEVLVKRLEMNPSSRGLYVDTAGVIVTPHDDTIANKDFKWVRDSYSLVVPGLMEWYERYLQYIANPNDDFDWKGWHRDGILFTKQIYFSLPRCIPMRYVIPAEDNSNTLDSFDVTEEQLNSLLAILGDASTERDPVTNDNIVVGVKEEEGDIVIRLKIKGKYDCYTFQMEYETLKLLREFLEKIALNEQKTISWESQQSENGMYFYPQTIGGLKHMGQLHIFSEREFAFSAYINTRHFVRSLYRSIMTHAGSLSDNTAYKLFQSNIMECYIDDERYKHISFYRKNPKLANFIGPAIDNGREYFCEIYETILNEDETV
jgi:hypothetical protein